MASLTPAASAAVNALSSGAAAAGKSLMDVAFGKGGAGTQTTDANNAQRTADADSTDVEINEHSPDELGNDDLFDEDSPADSEADADEDSAADAEADDGEADEEDGEADAAEGKAKPKTKGDVEKIKVAGQEIEIDFSDRDAIKRAYAGAAGMRKFQAERDTARTELTKLKEAQAPLTEDANVGKQLSEAWDKEGIAGLVRVLTKGQQTYDQVHEAEAAHRARLAKMSPDQRAAHEAKQEAERVAAEAKRKEAEYEAKLKKFDERAENAERTELSTSMNTQLKKHSFAGKLGDPAAEATFDRMLFRDAREELVAALKDYGDDQVVPQELIEKVWADTAKTIRRAISKQVREETNDTLKTKKVEAKSQAQAQMQRGASKKSTSEQALRDSMRKGDVKGGIMNFLKSRNSKK